MTNSSKSLFQEIRHCRRDTDEPALTLGPPGSWDDQHVFAPCVARMDGECVMWYCGSRGDAERRKFSLGLAKSVDGKKFVRTSKRPVFELSGSRSVLTPALLREMNGAARRENGKLRFWYVTRDFVNNRQDHVLHSVTTPDGVQWEDPSPPLLSNVYSPSVLREGGTYSMWYADPGETVWPIRHAISSDGLDWKVDPTPVLEVDQDWEHRRLNYPWVVKTGEAYLMWYSSRTDGPGGKAETAIGVARGEDGLPWEKNPDNPVLCPDSTRPWESSYTSDPCVLPMADGSLRMWYSTRTSPANKHKYFAISTALSELRIRA